MPSHPVTATRADSDLRGATLAASGVFAAPGNDLGRSGVVLAAFFEGVATLGAFGRLVTGVLPAKLVVFDAGVAKELCVARAVSIPTERPTRAIRAGKRELEPRRCWGVPALSF
jgi:hypothetical protein